MITMSMFNATAPKDVFSVTQNYFKNNFLHDNDIYLNELTGNLKQPY